ncbi:MATE family efflux transporter [Photobacterium aphoticum]|uniref:Multidrug resistance protein NorM n=1 Tax=Photobacterium aphoticum TaxID=754436 RepID=A0A0J1GHV7_9GAMM|nr:MATE family efflux transporter [Photobacterium aphoticum]KLU99289.1 hypothetical protein ABT58_18345 [Photobacterium aphoticum]PSU55304.1 multidrug transporter MatE [Photobacterium aphoticum]GHA46218.1 multidrug efflux MATE transporter FepA [Photobacterium aphoticum]
MDNNDYAILHGPPLRTFIAYAVPSLLGLLAISTASIIDGIFVGHYLGADALAAINLLVPYITFMFAVCLMIAIGGSVMAGHYLGENKSLQANQIFTLSLFSALAFTCLMALLSHLLYIHLFQLLGAPPSLFSLMKEYLSVMSFCLVIQLTTMVCYYFVRTDGFPRLGTTALLCGAACNIALDALFIGYFRWGLAEAALATTLAQCLQCVVLSRYFFQTKRRLAFCLNRLPLRTLGHALRNGCSEFINEISVGIIIFAVHWQVASQHGEAGIAGFAITNYILFISMMMFYGIIDAQHVLLSHNLGAGQPQRAHTFMRFATLAIACIGGGITLFTFIGKTWITTLFLGTGELDAALFAHQYLNWLWPCILLSGFNVLFSGYFTAHQRPKPSACIALLRGLLLPLLFLFLFTVWPISWHVLAALPLAEGITLLIAIGLYLHQIRHSASAIQACGHE